MSQQKDYRRENTKELACDFSSNNKAVIVGQGPGCGLQVGDT